MADMSVPSELVMSFAPVAEPIVTVTADGRILRHGKEITTFEEAVAVIHDIVRLMGNSR